MTPLAQISGTPRKRLACGDIELRANEINSLSFSIANPDSTRRAAISIAVSRAKGDAEAAARAAGGTLGNLIELTIGEIEAPVFRAAAFASMRKEASDTQIEPGLQPVRASVTVRWQFVPR